jgi:hypothetical protein
LNNVEIPTHFGELFYFGVLFYVGIKIEPGKLYFIIELIFGF